MDSFITLIGSIIIGGLLSLRVLTFQSDLKEHTYKQTDALMVQNKAMGIIEILAQDLKNIGVGVPPAFFIVADNDTLEYNVDVDDDGIPDVVGYFLSDTTAAAATPNPNDKILYRKVNAVQTLVAWGVTDFQLKYFNQTGNETNVLPDIKTIEVTLQLEGTTPQGGEFSSFFWQEKITPPKLLY